MIRRTISVVAALGIVLGAVTGCSVSDDYDGVLWRQIDALKQPLARAFNEMRATDRAVFLDSVVSGGELFPGEYWGPGVDLPTAAIGSGGVFISRLIESVDDTEFLVMITSGPRVPAADPVTESDPYGGPPSIYTCFTALVEFADDRLLDWSWEEAACDPTLASGLNDQAEFVPLYEFAG